MVFKRRIFTCGLSFILCVQGDPELTEKYGLQGCNLFFFFFGFCLIAATPVQIMLSIPTTLDPSFPHSKSFKRGVNRYS
jgi:hypothetical protein